MNMEELWDLYDENRIITGKKHVRGVQLPLGAYHVVVEVWTLNKEGKLLLTQRHPDKPFALKWECSGGSVIAGEDSITGAIRELSEEVGITVTPKDLSLLHTTQFRDRFYDTYITIQDIRLEDLILQKEEVVDVKFVTYEELIDLWKKGVVVPRERFNLYRKELEQFVNEYLKNLKHAE